ncbi:MAG: RrF2 family transcriptional regulator [Pirellulaceae bacterium]
MSQKCRCTLRALFELAKRQGEGPVSAAEIATAQALPPRILELILHALTKSEEVKSRRGLRGGYVLAVSPTAMTVGDVVRLVDGSAAPANCVEAKEGRHCPLSGRCAFFWNLDPRTPSRRTDLRHNHPARPNRRRAV